MRTTTETAGHYALMPGTRAVIDTLTAGLVPVKVTACHDRMTCTVQVTANRPGYQRGETLVLNALTGRVYPRTAIVQKFGRQQRIVEFPRVCYPAPGRDYTRTEG